jgi:hypothetical protein
MRKKTLDHLIDEQLRLPPTLAALRDELKGIPGVTGVCIGCRYRGGARETALARLVAVPDEKGSADLKTGIADYHSLAVDILATSGTIREGVDRVRAVGLSGGAR